MLSRSGLFLVVFWVLGPAALLSVADESADWSGDWDSRWRDGGAKLSLQQEGDRVWGEYPLYQGRIEAKVIGRELHGEWIEPKNRGSFIFRQNRDGNSFSGRFESGEWWTGARSQGDASQISWIDQSRPEFTLRTFMRLMNLMGPGSMDMLGDAANMLAPIDEAQTGISRLDHAQLLFRVLDGMTFRIWGISRNETSDRFTKKFKQAGSDVTVELEFAQVGERWYIVPPEPELLEQTLAAQQLARAKHQGGNLEIRPFLTPRDTFRNFLNGLRQRGYTAENPVMQALDTSQFNEVTRDREVVLLANYIKRTLDRISFIIWQELPDDPDDRTPYVHFQHPAGEIVVAPRETEQGIIWQFTPDTLRNIRNLYAAVDEMPIEAGMPPSPPENTYFAMRDWIGRRAPNLLRLLGPMERWQWLGLAINLAIGLLSGILLSRVLGWLVHAWRRDSGSILGVLVAAWAPAAFLLGASCLMSDRLLGFPDTVAAVVTTLGWCLIVLSLTLVLMWLIDLLASRYRSRDDLPGHLRSLSSLVAGVSRIGVLVAAILLLAHLLAIPYQGVLAGLGIGGLAFALAAQPTLLNFLSGVTLYLDRPIAAGDFCRFGDKVGTVEYIGVRSTRIRTLDRTLVTVPNSEFLNMQLENYAHRDRNILKETLQLRYETTPDQMRLVLVELRKLLIAHPKVSADPLRVRFIGFGEHSLDIEIFAYLMTPDYSESLAIREDLNLRIMVMMDEVGVQFAFPSAVHYQAQDKLSDPALAAKAAETVAAWKANQTLPFPDFAWQDKAEISSTLDYPPQGSVLAQVMREPASDR
jgi:MscS family membrane protein